MRGAEHGSEVLELRRIFGAADVWQQRAQIDGERRRSDEDPEKEVRGEHGLKPRTLRIEWTGHGQAGILSATVVRVDLHQHQLTNSSNSTIHRVSLDGASA